MSSEYGKNIKLTVFGQSHGAAVGMTLTGLPAGKRVDMDLLCSFLKRRAPGSSPLVTARREADEPKVLAGIYSGYTTGTPICIIFENSDIRSGDYEQLRRIPRPGHADYSAFLKYGEKTDMRGGGHLSGRLTAPICAAGGILMQLLCEEGISIGAHLIKVGDVSDEAFDPVNLTKEELMAPGKKTFPVKCDSAGERMQDEIVKAKDELDSIGGCIECGILGIRGGIGAPMFDGVENAIAKMVFGIPGVKALEYGAGTEFSGMRGSDANDPFTIEKGAVRTATNNAGGINGGITNGMPVIFKATFRPTPSIARVQKSVDMLNKTEAELTITGRHDPCIAVRAVPVIEAAAAIAIYDILSD